MSAPSLQTAGLPENDWRPTLQLATLVGLLLLLIWAYLNSLTRLADHFWQNPKYSHGYLVPIFAIILLWLRRDTSWQTASSAMMAGLSMAGVGIVLAFLPEAKFFPDLSPVWLQRYELMSVAITAVGGAIALGRLPRGEVSTAARLTGLVLLAGGLGMRLLATYLSSIVPELYSFLPCLIGLLLLVGGWPTLKWAGTATCFLIFMFPLPSFLDQGLLLPMQKFATICSTYALQTLGIACFNEGNTIRMGETNIGIIEACSGLRMLTIFVAISFAITMITERPIWERVILVLSSIPIALFVNITRITVTGVLYLIASHPNSVITKELAENVFHDLAGWVMMPLALGMLYVEFQILSHLIIHEVPKGGVIGMRLRRSRPNPAIGS
jgi:exosortase